jgi:hypothetical protein
VWGVCRLLISVVLVASIGWPSAAFAAGHETNPNLSKAVAIAERTQAVKELRARGRVTSVPEIVEGTKWRVGYVLGNQRQLEVDVDVAARGSVDKVWSGPAAGFAMARGYKGWFGAHVTEPWIWLPLCAVFLLLFVDRRRPSRIVHLDLVVIVAGFGVSQWLFQRGYIRASVPLSYLPLSYLFIRMLTIARRDDDAPRLEPVLGVRALTAVLIVLCAFRIGLNLFDSNDHDYVGWGRVGSTVVDVGYAGVAGASRIGQGLEVYTPTAHLDTYGPLNYVAYFPFESIWPFTGAWGFLPAAHAAAIAFDLLTIAGLFVLGVRLLPGPGGRLCGLGMACAWAACPYTAYVLNSNTNDALVSASITWALVAFRSSVLSGLALALGAGAKFIPAALLPALTRLRRPGGPRYALMRVAVFAVILAVAVLVYAPPQGVDLVWGHTIARQNDSVSPFSIWGMWDAIRWVRTPLELLTVVGAALFAFGRDRSVVQAAAVGAALILAVQLTAMHWIYFYIVWFLPLVFVALFAPAGAWRGAPTPRS